MDLVLASLFLHFVSGLCINLVPIDNYLRNNSLLEAARDTIGKLSRQELTVNNEVPTRPRRIFKVVPVKANNKWNNQLLVQPDLRHITENVPVALIVAAKSDFYNLKSKNESYEPLTYDTNNITENKPQTVDFTNDSQFIYNNDIANKMIANLGPPMFGNLQNVVTSNELHVGDDTKESDIGNENDEDNKKDEDNEDVDSREHGSVDQSEPHFYGEPSDREDEEGKEVDSNEDSPATPASNSSICQETIDGMEIKSKKSESKGLELHFDVHKYFNDSGSLQQELLSTPERDFNLYIIFRN